jgi:lipopolysaccharide transport system ATP-binding protein
MSETSIRAEKLGKTYALGRTADLGRTFRDTLAGLPRFLGKKAGQALQRAATEGSGGGRSVGREFWALRDVSFEVSRGEAIGIIGKNGAGKSTLLKILSRVTSPTTGFAELHGRVGSLLEVGTGFHPELSGRDNVFLNGVILGMRKREIEAKFDEIVEFAEVREFLDTPVKRFSIGMRVRLAFAVAAHLDPEILIVDEVLAVGDAAFRKKCMEKMREVATQGRTILLVSHNMSSVRELCDRALLLDEGQLVAEGAPGEVISRHLSAGGHEVSVQRWENPDRAPGDEFVRLTAVRLKEGEGDSAPGHFMCNEAVEVEISYRVLKPSFVVSEFSVVNEEGRALFLAGEFQDEFWQGKSKEAGEYAVTTRIPGNFLNEGHYTIDVDLISYSKKLHARVPSVLQFAVHDTLAPGSARGSRIAAGWAPVAVRPRFENSYSYDVSRYQDGAAE